MLRHMRTFVCVDIPEQYRKILASKLFFLKKNFPDIKWVHPKTLHLTLKFCGEQPEDVVNFFSSLITQELQNSSLGSFTVSLNSVGGFPSLSRPRTLWIGVDKGKKDLCFLEGLLERAGEKTGFEKEKKTFHPHLTLARIRTNSSITPELIETLKKYTFHDIVWKVESITLMKSDLRPEGANYTPLETYLLKC